jgi:hypothetical protein
MNQNADNPMMYDEESWAALLHMAQLNSLSLAYMLLTIMEDPATITEEIRDQVLHMVTELEWGIARFEEFVI